MESESMLRELWNILSTQPSSWESMDNLPVGVYSIKDDPLSSHGVMARLIRQHKPAGNVLDVGCAEGYISKSLHGLGGDYKITGVDVNPASLEAAKAYCDRVILADIEGPLDLDDRFDAIVLGDVIEHVRHPYRLLKRLKDLLRDDGIVVLSVPNFAHWSVRLQLLMGSFNYRSRGITDRTHLRFFTRRSLRALVAEAALRVIAAEYTPVPLPILNARFGPQGGLFFLHQCNGLITRCWPNMLAYQMVMVLKKA